MTDHTATDRQQCTTEAARVEAAADTSRSGACECGLPAIDCKGYCDLDDSDWLVY